MEKNTAEDNASKREKPTPATVIIPSLNPTVELSGAPVVVRFQSAFAHGIPLGPDSALIPNFLSAEEAKELFEKSESMPLNDRTKESMQYRGKPLPRDKITAIPSRDLIPIYTYPGMQFRGVSDYKTFAEVPELGDLVNKLNTELQVCFGPDEVPRSPAINHVIGTRYASGKDNISFHSDSATDIAPDSVILMLSTGAVRELHFRFVGEKHACMVIRLEPGMLIVMGPKTNATMQHAVVPQNKHQSLARNDPSLGHRFSIVFRNISTTMSREKALRKAAQSEKNAVARAQKKREHAQKKRERDEIPQQHPEQPEPPEKLAKTEKEE